MKKLVIQEVKKNIYLIASVLIFASVNTVMADQVLQTSKLDVVVSDDTGQIKNISIGGLHHGDLQKDEMLTDGNLLALDWNIKPKLHSNKILSGKESQQLIETVFHVNDELIIRRHVHEGEAPYSLLVSYKITNTSSDALQLASILKPSLQFAGGFKKINEEGGGYGAWIYGYRDLFISHRADLVKVHPDNMEDVSGQESTQWIGWVNRRHVIALRSIEPTNISVDAAAALSGLDEKNDYFSPAKLTLTLSQNGGVFQNKLLPGESVAIIFESVIAPKLWDQLSLVKPTLEGVVLLNLWDWFRKICFVVWQLLNILFNVIGNWGVVIVFMAFIVRILIIPITRISLQYQDKAIEQEARIRPLLVKVKEQYKGIEQSKQLVSLYEQQNYDQLASLKGMLGLFVQIPILIALFNVLGEASEFSGVPFLWFNDLSISDRLFPLGIDIPFFGAYFNLLPFLMGAVTVLSTYYAARTSGKNLPKRSLYGMAVLFFILFYSFPAALVLYWLCSTFFQFLQQVIENRIK